ncbi:MAG: hypothetical protein L6R37_003750 [Teloschistes peruensis]|nr:MAG: hypothetical protein L6R37_003750 [Teloschistes peruensis]
MSNDLLEITGHQAAAGPAKRQKVVHHRDPPCRPRAARIFGPFRTVGLVSPTSVPFTSLPLGKTTFQITTSVGRCLHTYDLRRGLNLVFISRPQTPALITATVAWKEKVLAAWGGKATQDEIGVWVFERGKKCGELEIPHDLHEPVEEIIAFGSWIIGRCSTRIEVWKSAKYEHYTTITPTASRGTARGSSLSGGICNIPTYLNKVLVGKQDGSVDIWNVSTGKLVYTILPSNLDSGAVTALQPTPALSLVAIARVDGSISIQDIYTDKTVLKLRHRDGNGASISSISFRTDGHGAGEDGREPGIMATAASEDSDVRLWDLNNGGRVVGILHGAHNPPSSHPKGDSVSGGISKIEFLPGQDVMITSGLDNALKSWIFDANSLSTVPRILHSRSGHAAPVTKLCFMPTNSEDADATGKWLLSAGRDQSLWGWSIRRDGQSSELSQGPVRKKAKKLGLLSKTLETDSSVKLEELKAPEITCFASSLNRDGGMGATPGAGRIWTNMASRKGTNDTSESGSTGWENIVTGHRGDKYARTWFWGRKRAGRWAFETGDGTEVSTVAESQAYGPGYSEAFPTYATLRTWGGKASKGRDRLDGRSIEQNIDDITEIVWNPSSFDNLAIPATKKRVITALAKAHMSRASDDVIDDFVEGKGQGLITLLHGPPGVGKTLTVEGLSEYLERPLYTISAGELGQDAKKAILLLDEADVFVQSRSSNNPHNALVSVFLRTLEYYRGIMILTTNRVKDIDDAIQSRNSIKNMINTAHALAVDEMVPLSRSHLEIVIDLDKEFQKDYNGAGQKANESSYF